MSGRLVLAAVLALAGCAAGPRPSQAPAVEAPTLEQLYLDERFGEVVVAAEGIIEADDEPRERVAEARFYRALAWQARDPYGNRDRALLELRNVEFEYSDLIWGRLAGHHVADAARVDALQVTLLELAVEQRDCLARIDELEQHLADAQSELAARESKLADVERERDELREQLDSARTRAAETAVRLRELEAELAALKQIDMQREP